MLDMEGTAYPRPSQRQGLVSYPRGSRKRTVDGSSVGAQNRIGIDHGSEYLADMLRIELFQDHIGHRTTAVTDHQHRHMIQARAAGAADATAFAPVPIN